jgi:hypothetical protein
LQRGRRKGDIMEKKLPKWLSDELHARGKGFLPKISKQEKTRKPTHKWYV